MTRQHKKYALIKFPFRMIFDGKNLAVEIGWIKGR